VTRGHSQGAHEELDDLDVVPPLVTPFAALAIPMAAAAGKKDGGRTVFIGSGVENAGTRRRPLRVNGHTGVARPQRERVKSAVVDGASGLIVDCPTVSRG